MGLIRCFFACAISLALTSGLPVRAGWFGPNSKDECVEEFAKDRDRGAVRHGATSWGVSGRLKPGPVSNTGPGSFPPKGRGTWLVAPHLLGVVLDR